MNVNVVLPVSKVLGALGRPIVYYPEIGRALGSMDAAVFLGNFMYWDGKQADKTEGWIFKNSFEISKETGLKRSRQESAREVLRNFGILQEKKEDFPPKVYYRFIWDALDKVMSDHILTNNPDMKPEDILKEVIPEKPKKEKIPPKEKPPKTETDKMPSVIYQMKEIFDQEYEVLPGKEIGYQWSKDKKGGKDWGNLKMLKNTFIERAQNRRKKELITKGETPPEKTSDIEISDEELLVSWKLFLANLPPYHQERNFTPALLYSNFNPIIQEIYKNVTNPKPAAAVPNSTPEDYAD